MDTSEFIRKPLVLQQHHKSIKRLIADKKILAMNEADKGSHSGYAKNYKLEKDKPTEKQQKTGTGSAQKTTSGRPTIPARVYSTSLITRETNEI